MAAIDFESEGLLDGVEGEAREARLKLLRELAEEGVSLDELRVAVAEERLAVIPVERVLSGGGERFNAAEVAERAGIDREFLERDWRALGMALSATMRASTPSATSRPPNGCSSWSMPAFPRRACSRSPACSE